MLMLGLAGAVVDLSGTEVSVFDQPKLAKDGSSPMSDMGIDAAFLKDNPADGKPINQSKPPLLLGSMTGITPAWLAGLDPMPLPTPAEQVAAYLNRSVV